MDHIIIKTPNPEWRLNWCLIELVDWRYSQSCMMLSSTPFVKKRPSNLLTGSPPPSPPLPPFPVWIRTGVCILQCLTRVGGIGLCGDHLQELYSCIWPDSEPTQSLFHPKQKPTRGGGPHTDKHLKKIRHLGLESVSYLVHGWKDYTLCPSWHRDLPLLNRNKQDNNGKICKNKTCNNNFQLL